MTRTTVFAALLMLAALPAAAQSETEALALSREAGTPSLWDGRMVDADPTVFYSGPMIGLPSLTDTRPSSAGDLPAPGFLVITEPTVALNHLDFGAYEPYAPAIARQALKGIADEAAATPAGSGLQGIALSVDGTSTQTRLATSYAAQSGPVDVKAKAGLVVPAVLPSSRSTTAFIRSGNVQLAMTYKF